MKYSFSLISLLIIFVALFFFEGPIVLFLKLLIIPSFYLILFYWEYSVFDKKIESSFKIKSQKKLITWYHSFFVIQMTMITINLNFDTSTKIILLLFTWTAIVLDIIIFFLYKKKKPYTLFIRNNEFIFIEKWTNKRDITGLNRILFDRISKKLEFRFDDNYKLKINTLEYKKADIDKLLELLLEKSNYPISIPNNYKEE
ncbi:hypothetical protein MC378_08690 [Polaribacter sp. MSW13]|uniref:Uncharacterized protein n=1 Tax=Polaribacter marinus TaxID=2916838 RepID=A0A9X2AJP4_9FLAO|nr:hypothetical protein [Polaribacter marinus]MCI2229242.1 hypothetical protein [Polaribacter marinus]